MNAEKFEASSDIYLKSLQCPLCQKSFKEPSVRSSSSRIDKKDSDFFIYYKGINPYFYDVWQCSCCGYTALKADFLDLKEHQKESILRKITTKWNARTYNLPYNAETAIERYKLALVNAVAMGSKSSTKAMLLLKIAWMHRLTASPLEEHFLKEALTTFKIAYNSEDTPFYGMDEHTLKYLIGELHRRLDYKDEALKWFGEVITCYTAPQKIKDLARDQRDKIKNIY